MVASRAGCAATSPAATGWRVLDASLTSGRGQA